MSGRLWHIIRAPHRFLRNQDGSTVVEMAFVLPLFLLLFTGIIDFGRLAFHYVAAEKSVQVAARIAAVRPAVCQVPTTNLRGPFSSAGGPRFGTNCDFASGVCVEPSTASCSAATAFGTNGQATASEIWTRVQFAVPNDPNASFGQANISFSYDFDPAMNFLGGPFVPMVTVTIEDLPFRFVSPLGALAALVIGGATNETQALTNATTGYKIFSDFTATLPGEDLASGSRG